jgi:hypothetical protein
MLGKAMDWYLPGVKLATLRATALRFEAGGVGYYPRSGSPFIHTDVGNVRHWPRMSRSELLAVFPDGRTIHVPSDGRPLPGYEQAVAAYESRKRSGGSIQIASSSSSTGKGGRKTLLGMLFGGGADEDEDSGESPVTVASAAKPSRPAATKPVVAAREADEEPATAQAPALARTQQPIIVPDLPVRDAPAPLTAPRPEAPMTETPEDAQALAFAVPLPVRRPDYTPQITPAEETPTADVPASNQMALATPVPRPADSAAAIRDLIAAEVPETGTPAQAQMANALVPVPFDKPKHNDMVVASIVPSQRPVAPVSQQAVIPVPDDSLTPESVIEQADNARTPIIATPKPVAELPTIAGTTRGRLQPQQDTQLASAEPQPSLRRSMLAAKGDPVAMLDSGVMTTVKKAKPQRRITQDQSIKAIQVSSDVPDRALSARQVANIAPAVTPAVLRTSSMRRAPTTVYTAGFQPALPADGTNKFTGKAVTFMQIARFNPVSGL